MGDSRRGSGSSGAAAARLRRHSWGGALQQWAEPEPAPVVLLHDRLLPSASLVKDSLCVSTLPLPPIM